MPSLVPAHNLSIFLWCWLTFRVPAPMILRLWSFPCRRACVRVRGGRGVLGSKPLLGEALPRWLSPALALAVPRSMKCGLPAKGMTSLLTPISLAASFPCCISHPPTGASRDHCSSELPTCKSSFQKLLLQTLNQDKNTPTLQTHGMYTQASARSEAGAWQ